MAIRIIPIDPQLVAQKFKISLDAVTYTFDLDFNERTGRFRLNIFDDLENELIFAIPMLVNYDLLKFHKFDPLLPQGTLFLVNLEEDNVDPSLGDLGSSVIMVYDEAI